MIILIYKYFNAGIYSLPDVAPARPRVCSPEVTGESGQQLS